jgi:thiamine-phosphate pyrophosphorylase
MVMATPRLFLLAPDGLSAEAILSCATAAYAAGDVASTVLPVSAMTIAPELQALGLAVLCNGMADTSSDGVHLDASEVDIASARKRLGPRKIIGAFCGASRDLAMRAGEAGADYVALSQNSKTVGEPIIGWWSALFEVPCVAFDPFEPQEMDILLPQNPDFIRPSDAMWESADLARDIVSRMMRRIAG